MNKNKASYFAALLMPLLMAANAYGQLSDSASWSSTIQNDVAVIADITYLKANNMELKLDVYRPRDAQGPVPTFIYYHGGGWVGGSKEANVLRLMPYLEMGWAVVNVQYRLGNVSLAPAAVEDCRCALRWVIRNAENYGFDTEKLVVSGNSAGGHLALTTGMLTAAAGLDRQCPGNEDLQVAAIVNWYGITDVGDLLAGENMKTYAVQWMGSMPNRMEIAGLVSPMNYVTRELPPIITIHGDADPVVPYQHGVQLHQALDTAEVPNQLVTVPGGGHGGFPNHELLRIYGAIQSFLNDHL